MILLGSIALILYSPTATFAYTDQCIVARMANRLERTPPIFLRWQILSLFMLLSLMYILLFS